ncbi:MAG: Rieske (2Fe-2S) protein [Pseudomonadota bacterium]
MASKEQDRAALESGDRGIDDRYAVDGDKAPGHDPGSVTRRELLCKGTTLLVAGCGAAALLGSVRFVASQTALGAGKRFAIGRPADFKMGTLTWLRDEGVFVVRDSAGFGALSSRCTHLGCTVRRTAEGFMCPCHGARYAADGKVVSGPARRGLPWYYLWLEADGRIWIDIAQEVQPQTNPLSMA